MGINCEDEKKNCNYLYTPLQPLITQNYQTALIHSKKKETICQNSFRAFKKNYDTLIVSVSYAVTHLEGQYIRFDVNGLHQVIASKNFNYNR